MSNLNDIKTWYMGALPEDTSRLSEFLINSFKLGHDGITKYEHRPAEYAIPSDVDTGIIPNWVLSDALTDLKGIDKNAATTAFWNTSILMNKAMLPASNSVHYAKNYALSPVISYGDFAVYLHEMQRLLDSKFAPFAKQTVETTHTLETIKAAAMEYMAGNKQALGKVVEHYQNPALREIVEELVGEKASDILREITYNHTLTLQQLFDLAIALKDALLEEQKNNDQNQSDDDDQDQQENESQSGGGGAGNQDQEGNGDQEDQSSPLQDLLEGDVKPSDNKLHKRRTSPEMRQALEDMNEALTQAGWGDSKGEKTYVVRDVTLYNEERYQPVKETDELKSLSVLVQQIKVIRRKPHQAMWYGRQLLDNQLHRIITDQHIFGNQQEKRLKIPKEWVIANDFSGSTVKGYGTNSLHYRILQASKGAFLALRDAGETVSVYGHTTSHRNTLMVKVADNHSSQLDKRFNCALNVDHCDNYDYDAIAWLRKNAFHIQDSLKVIIMLSDGQPCPVGEEGTNLLIAEIKDARRQGFIVFSVSLVPEVVSKNDNIYGKEWNIDASKGTIESKLSELIVRISKEYRG